ncbi:MAG: hypothetical protein FD130_2545, partial [Halothiobacillaceae bacterium]
MPPRFLLALQEIFSGSQKKQEQARLRETLWNLIERYRASHHSRTSDLPTTTLNTIREELRAAHGLILQNQPQQALALFRQVDSHLVAIESGHAATAPEHSTVFVDLSSANEATFNRPLSVAYSPAAVDDDALLARLDAPERVAVAPTALAVPHKVVLAAPLAAQIVQLLATPCTSVFYRAVKVRELERLFTVTAKRSVQSIKLA